MVKVIIGYKVKTGADIQSMLMRLRSHAMTYNGFVGAENLINDGDSSIVAIITTWESIEDWKAWEASSSRQEIVKQAKPLLEDERRVTVYRVIPTRKWA